MLSCDDAARANNTRSSEKRFREKGMEEGRAVQAGDGWMDGGREAGRERERGMLREEDSIFIAAAVFIAAQRRGESGGCGLGCGFRTASQGSEGEREGVGGERQLWRE